MDPFSIFVGCVGLCEAITKATFGIASLIQTVSDARDELRQISNQLKQLKVILALIQQNFGPNEELPEPQRHEIFSIINNCLDTLKSIGEIVEEHNRQWGPSLWALKGKKKVQAVSRKLDMFIQQLHLILQGSNSAMLQVMTKHSNITSIACGEIRHDILDVREDTTILKAQSSDQTRNLSLIYEKLSSIDSGISTLLNKHPSLVTGDSWEPQVMRDNPTASGQEKLSSSINNISWHGSNQLRMTEPCKRQPKHELPLSEEFSSSQSVTHYSMLSSGPMSSSEATRSSENKIASQFKQAVLARARGAAKNNVIQAPEPDQVEHIRRTFKLQVQQFSKNPARRRTNTSSNVMSSSDRPKLRSAHQQAVVNSFQRMVMEVASTTQL
ncbi:hypothetical protein B0J13DRAFT_167791 [Dactylonectria estremocensis]|uniref:Fungal N-terminal domain-containing protein n=1 Tax=Dactylonectria estremocensis TaxID=1079267 RepID=A0A9P9FAT1_9HYPO|nr:hypothetical protein B0J13DRAFT_167791 [Dactylonectria estremocensis]